MGVVIVEIADRLVGEDERRVVGERPRNRDALLLSATQFRRAVSPSIAKTDSVEEFEGALGMRPPFREHRHKDVLKSGKLHCGNGCCGTPRLVFEERRAEWDGGYPRSDR